MISDKELIKKIGIDKKTLTRFKEIRDNTIKDAKSISRMKKNKLKVLGISGSARSEFDMAQEKSNSETLLEFCLKECKRLGAETELLFLRDYDIKYCKACYSTVNTHCHFPCSCYPKGTKLADDMSNLLYDKIIDADVIVFATPVNNFKPSSLLSLFLDRCISLDGSLEPANKDAPKSLDLNKKHMMYVKMTADNDVPGSGMLKRFLGKTAGIIVTGHEEGASMVISSLYMTLNHFGMVFPPFSGIYAMSNYCNPTDQDKKMVISDCYKEEVIFLANNLISMAKSLKNLDKMNWRYDYRMN